MIELKIALDALDPRIWWVGVTLLVYLLVWCWRWVSRYLPAVLRFEACPSRLRALPAVGLATAIGATGIDSAEIAKILLDLVLAAISGVTAVGGHEMLGRLLGAAGATAPTAPPGG
jgi:hypothetical protein